jgi:hypothetical protein
MNTIRVYIDEKLDTQQLEHLLMGVTHVIDVEIGKNDPRELVIEYEEHHNMPIKIIETLRSEGFHPDILSA